MEHKTKLTSEEFSSALRDTTHVAFRCGDYWAIYRYSQVRRTAEGKINIVGRSVSAEEGQQAYHGSIKKGKMLPIIDSPLSLRQAARTDGFYMAVNMTVEEVESKVSNMRMTDNDHKLMQELGNDRYIAIIGYNNRCAIYRRTQIEKDGTRIRAQGKSLTKKEVDAARQSNAWPPQIVYIAPPEQDQPDFSALTVFLYGISFDEINGPSKVRGRKKCPGAKNKRYKSYIIGEEKKSEDVAILTVNNSRRIEANAPQKVYGKKSLLAFYRIPMYLLIIYFFITRL